MCIDIKYIYTRSRIISPFHRERLLIPCKCGKCVECQTQLKNEWYYRIYQEWKSTIEDSPTNFVFFDTLTYSDEFLPHLSEFIDVPIHSDFDFPCFSYEDFRFFMMRLRRSLEYQGYDIRNNLSYFLASEYGTSDEYTDSKGRTRIATHRPHYHVLFFSRVPDLTVAHLRHAIDNAWFFGRTDRVRYYGKRANYFKSTNHEDRNSRNVSSYVAKYVQKLSLFQNEIDFRLTEILKYIYESRFSHFEVTKSHHNFDNPLPPLDGGRSSRWLPGHHSIVDRIKYVFDGDGFDSFCRSETGKKLISDLKRLVNQFHRQSPGFGASALRDLDILEVMDTGFLTMPDSHSVIRKISLPKYYERLLFEELVEFNGIRVWQPSKLGLLYRQRKSLRVLDYLENKYHNLSEIFHEYQDLNFHRLAQYCVYQRYRYNGHLANEVRFEDKVNLPNKIYSYCTQTDRALLHGSFVSSEFIGCQGEYYSNCLDHAIPISVFLKNHMIRDDCFEAILHRFNVLQLKFNRMRQLKFEMNQEYSNRKQIAKQLDISFD